MNIGMPKEIKPGESRVVMTPVEVKELVIAKHTILVEAGAGSKAGFSDQDYEKAGARICPSRETIYSECELIVKVKEFLPEEYQFLREGQVLFTCIHPAANKELVDVLLNKKVVAFTAEDTHQYSSPNSEAAGKLGALLGTYHLLSINGGSGKIVGGIAGAPGIHALVIGSGTVGKSAVDVLVSLGANVTLMDINLGALRDAQFLFSNRIFTAFSNQEKIKEILPSIDLVVNAVKWPKHRSDHLITRDMLKLMQNGSVIVDISADVGGAIETFRPTTFENPTYIEEGVVHFGVDNIPGAAPHTTSIAYAASVFHHIQAIAEHGPETSARKNGYLKKGLTCYKGVLTHEETSLIQNREYTSTEVVLGMV